MLLENKKPELYTINKRKIAFSRDNNKKRVEADGVTMLARGYLA